MSEINAIITRYAAENGYTYDQAGSVLLDEIISEIDCETNQNAGISVCSNSNGSTQLPKSQKGDIFFTDNDKAWNHVGMYTNKDQIIEATPDYGVLEVSIYDPRSFQDTTGEKHDDSCILRIITITDTQINNAVEWARQQDGKEYEYLFLNNKTNDEQSNQKFNCSELVWKAFKFGADIDLDSNKGSTVYPNNIYNSESVYIVQEF